MNRSTKSIALVLIGSAVTLGGCGFREEEDEEWPGATGGSGFGPAVASGTNTHTGSHSTVHRSGGVVVLPVPIGGGGVRSGFSGGGSSVGSGGRSSVGSVGGSARGGFGSIGRGSVGS